MEILAPAGSEEALFAAVQSGADAVYIGGTEFSARKSAANFTLSQIEQAVRYCHLRDVKLHVAANILIKETEKERFLEYIGKLNKIGVDAVIIQDIGMAKAVLQMYPDLPLHASTQMTVTNISGAIMLKNMGFSRIVLARELSKEAIKMICDNVDIETEVFGHGAICMCYSGQCLFSSIIGGRSGNRGMCAQPCRLPYSLGGDKAYYLSPKDLSMIEHINELSKMGVTSLKIEGRLKRKEYVSAVTSIYKKYALSGDAVSQEDKTELLNAFNRSGFTSGYYEDKLGKDMMALNNPSNISENSFSDKVKEYCKKDANFKKREIFISAKMRLGEPLTVSLWDNDGHFAEYIGYENLKKAEKNGLQKERAESQLLKLGGTSFFAKTAEIDLDNDVMVSVSQINEARRNAVKLLEDNILKSEKRREFPYIPPKTEILAKSPKLIADVLTFEQAKACAACGIDEIYVPNAIYEDVKREFPDISVIAKLPPVMRDDRTYEKVTADKVLVSNIGEIDEKYRCYGDYRLNITNTDSVFVFGKFERVTLSPELNLKELSKISGNNEIVAYGRLSLMLMENCPLLAAGKCQKRKIKEFLCDRMGEKFPLKCSSGCVLELLNSKPIFMADRMKDLLKLNVSALRLIFTVENFAECGKIIEKYRDGILGKQVETPPQNSFTRGHFYRKVE